MSSENLSKGRFCLEPAGDSTVSKHLQIICQEILQLGIEPVGLVLGGSFGRGEGLVQHFPNSGYRPVNDYDIIIVTERKLSFIKRRNLKELAHRLSAQLEIWHLDFIHYCKAELSCSEVKMLLFDLKFGGQIFYGDPALLDLIPYSGRILPESEIENLLINRCVSLLEAYPLQYQKNFKHSERQLSKVVYALMDYLLNTCGLYATRYQLKRVHLRQLEEQRNPALEELRKSLLLSIDWIEPAWCYEYIDSETVLKRWQDTGRLLIQALQNLIFARVDPLPLVPATIIENWRSNYCRPQLKSIFNPMLRSYRHRLVEKKIFYFLKYYPAANFVRELNFRIPEHLSKPEENTVWLNMREQLILEWYA